MDYPRNVNTPREKMAYLRDRLKEVSSHLQSFGSGPHHGARAIRVEQLHEESARLVRESSILVLDEHLEEKEQPMDRYAFKGALDIMLDAVETLQERYESVTWQISGEQVYISVSNISWAADEVHVTGPEDDEPSLSESEIRSWVISVTEKALDSDSWRNPE